MSDNNKDITEVLNKIKNRNSNDKKNQGLEEQDLYKPLDIENLDGSYMISEEILDELIADLERLNLELEEDDSSLDTNKNVIDELKLWEWAIEQERIADSLMESDKDFDIPPEFFDIIVVMELGAAKYGADSYLDPNNKSMKKRNNTASMFRHLAEHYMGVNTDAESGVDPLLHLACRALMAYTRKQRGIFEDE